MNASYYVIMQMNRADGVCQREAKSFTGLRASYNEVHTFLATVARNAGANGNAIIIRNDGAVIETWNDVYEGGEGV